MAHQDFTDKLKIKMDEYVRYVYGLTRKFPKDELYNITSQLRRALISIILNFIEGFARQRKAVKKNFWEISYGSLRETKYLLYFSFKEHYLIKDDYDKSLKMANEIGAMLWTLLQSLK